MTRFGRPVRQASLLGSPEMNLSYPGATGQRDGSGSDEGVGNGFDQGSPRAYAERWFTAPDDSEAVQRWFHDQLLSLGWEQVGDRPKLHVYRRDSDESIGVATFGEDVRLHFEVEGRWPDGSAEYRPQ